MPANWIILSRLRLLATTVLSSRPQNASKLHRLRQHISNISFRFVLTGKRRVNIQNKHQSHWNGTMRWSPFLACLNLSELEALGAAFKTRFIDRDGDMKTIPWVGSVTLPTPDTITNYSTPPIIPKVTAFRPFRGVPHTTQLAFHFQKGRGSPPNPWKNGQKG